MSTKTPPETETINKLFLELSQFTTATTAREIKLMRDIDELATALEGWQKYAERTDVSAGKGGCYDVAHQALKRAGR
jgi:hypothetical protein